MGELQEFVNIFGCRFPGLYDPGSSQYNVYRVPHPEAPYPQDYVIDQEGRVAYWSIEYEPQEIMQVIDRLLEQSSPIVIELTPINPPIVIPSGGGNIDFDVYLENVSASPQNFDAWIAIVYEGGAPTTAIQRAFSNYLPGWAINRLGNFFPVPGSYVAGNYTFTGKVGTHPDDVWAASGFPFIKDGDLGDPNFIPTVPENFPDPFGNNLNQNQTASELISIRNYPNPFNPLTAFTIRLSTVSDVKLSVYDITGRLVAELINGRRAPGYHEVTFDGSGLPSSLYLYRLEASSFTSSGKIVLMK
jgi:hypothetical protein